MCWSSGTVSPLPLSHPVSLKLGWGGETGVPHMPGNGCRPLSVGMAEGGCLPGGRHPTQRSVLQGPFWGLSTAWFPGTGHPVLTLLNTVT